jgi:hypothetical protein
VREFFLVLYGGGTRQEYLQPLKIGAGLFHIVFILFVHPAQTFERATPPTFKKGIS